MFKQWCSILIKQFYSNTNLFSFISQHNNHVIICKNPFLHNTCFMLYFTNDINILATLKIRKGFHMCIPCDFLIYFEILNLFHNLLTLSNRAFIYHMCTHCDKTFPSLINFYTFTMTFKLHFETFYLNHNFWTVISLVYSVCQDLPILPNFLPLWPWPLTYIF